MVCNFEKLCLFLDKQLSISQQLEILDHLDKCDICLETAHQLEQDRDAELYVRRKAVEHPRS